MLQMDPLFIYQAVQLTNSSVKILENLTGLSKNDSLNKMINFYKRIDPAQPYMKISHIIYICQRRKDIPLKERLDFLVERIAHDESLSAAKTADFIFWQLVGEKHEEWYDQDLTLDYWKKNKSKF